MILGEEQNISSVPYASIICQQYNLVSYTLPNIGWQSWDSQVQYAAEAMQIVQQREKIRKQDEE